MSKPDQPNSFQSVLRHLDAEDVKRLRLRPVYFAAGQRIGARGQEMRQIVFLESGAASLMVSFQDGRQAEAGSLHSESIVGLTALFGETAYLQDVVMQVAGAGYVCRREDAVDEFARSHAFQRMVLQCTRAQIAETTELVGCYATHEVSQRLSRWMLTYQDRAKCEEIAITQEVLSQILGATRPTISVVCEMFARRGLIQVRRGRIQVLDRAALEVEACECYRTLREFRRGNASGVRQVQDRSPCAVGLSFSDESFSIARDTVGREGRRRPGYYIH